MNILIVATDFKPMAGGVAEYTHQLAKHLHQAGDPVTVLAPHVKGDHEFDLHCPYPVLRFLKFQSKNNSYKERFNGLRYYFNLIRRSATKIRPDCIICTYYQYLGFHCFLMSKVLRLRYFILAHGSEVSEKALSFKDYWKRAMSFRGAKKIFSNSFFTKELVIRLGVKPEKIDVLPCGVPIDSINQKQEGSTIKERYRLRGKKIIFTLARLVERKGVDKVIESLGTVINEVPETIYLVGGEGYYQAELEKLVVKHCVKDKVIFTGYIPDEEKALYYNACDVFAMPCRELANGDVEGFGISFLEANACGKPVIAGSSGGAVEAVIHGKTGLIVNPLDTQEIAGAIIRLLKDEDYAKKLGEYGRRRTEEELNWQVIIHSKMRQKLY